VDRRVVLSAALVAHLVVAAAHGATHSLIPVHLPAWLNVVVVVTTFLGPVAGVALAWREHPLGVPLFTASLAAALLVGGALHFGFESPDHVHAVPAGRWRPSFRASAVGVAVTEAVGVAVGGRYWVREW
jgi:ABC-type xylose transport system permease subunit